MLSTYKAKCQRHRQLLVLGRIIQKKSQVSYEYLKGIPNKQSQFRSEWLSILHLL